MKDVIKKIIEAGCLAPSGENTQPWRFVVRGNSIDIFNIPERDESFYNIGQLGSYVAHGALLENMRVASQKEGVSLQVAYFPDSTQPTLVSRVVCMSGQSHDSASYQALAIRATNRRKYEQRSLSSDVIGQIVTAGNNTLGVQVKIIQDTKKMSQCAAAGSMADRLLFSNEIAHRFFFHHVLWTEKENQEKSIGLYLPTLEITKQQESGFKQFQKWKLLKTLNCLGFSRMIAWQNAGTYKTGSAYIAFVVSDLSPATCVRGGEVLERVWLACTRAGLATQPIAGLLFLRHSTRESTPSGMSNGERRYIHGAYEQIRQAVGGQSGEVLFLLRVGYAVPPSARASRLPPDITWYD